MADLVLPRNTPIRIVSEFFAAAREEAVRFERTVSVQYFDRLARRGPAWLARIYGPDGSFYTELVQASDVRTELLRAAQERHPEVTDWFSVIRERGEHVARCNICDGYIALFGAEDDIPGYAQAWIKEHEECERESLLYG